MALRRLGDKPSYEPMMAGARFTKDISHGIQIRWKFNFDLT